MLFWIVGGVIGLVGLVVAAWALWGDRARGRKRCGRCWYSMEGVSGLVCPECGRAARSERGLLRTRRRWWRAVGGVIVMGLGALVVVMPVVQRTSAITWLPRPVLVVLVRWTDTEGGPAFEELLSRANVPGAPLCAGWSAWEKRWLAAHAGEVVGREAVPLEALATGSDQLVLQELMQRGKSDDAASALFNSTAPHRANLLTTLGLLGQAGSPAIPGVVRALSDPRMSELSQDAIGRIGVGDDLAVDALIAMLNEKPGAWSSDMLELLLTIAQTPLQRERVEGALRSAILADSTQMRDIILRKLAKDGPPFPLDDELTRDVVQVIRDGPEGTAFLGARLLLQRFDSAGPVLDQIIRGGEASHAPAVMQAMRLRTPWPPPLPETVRWALEHGADVPTRLAAAKAASCLPRNDEPTVALLARVARDDDEFTVRSEALWSLDQLGSVEGTRCVAIAALSDAEANVREAAVAVLERLGSKDAAAREALCAARVEPDDKLAARVRARCEAWAGKGGK